MSEVRNEVIEAMSWAESFTGGRIGFDGAERLLSEYEAALVNTVIEECARDVEATADTNDGLARYELILAAHSLRTQVAAAFNIGRN